MIKRYCLVSLSLFPFHYQLLVINSNYVYFSDSKINLEKKPFPFKSISAYLTIGFALHIGFCTDHIMFLVCKLFIIIGL